MLGYYVIERDLPGVGSLSVPELGQAAKASNGVLAQMPGLQWQQSYVADDKTFCIYLAESEQTIHEHAARSGFPAAMVTPIRCIIDPTAERSCVDLAVSAAA